MTLLLSTGLACRTQIFKEQESSIANTVRIQMSDNLPMTLLPGTVIRLDYHNPKTNKYQWTVLNNLVASDVRHPFEGQGATIPLIPESISEYPYVLARERYGWMVRAVLTNPKTGYFEVDGHKTGLLDFSTILQIVLKTKMVVG